MIRREDFLMAVTQVRSMEKRLLKRQDFLKMLEAESPKHMLTALQGSGYLSFTKDSLNTSGFLHTMLNECLSDFLSEVSAILPAHEKEFLDILFLEYDMHNIQAMLMTSLEGDYSKSRVIPIPKRRAKGYINMGFSKSYNDNDSYYAELYKAAAEVFNKAPSKIHQWLDKKYYELIIKIAKNSGVQLFIDYTRTKVDFFNILTMLRIRRMKTLYKDFTEDDTATLYLDSIVPGGSISKDILEDIFSLAPLDMYQKTYNLTKYSSLFLKGLERYSHNMDTSIIEKSMDDYLTSMVYSKKYTAIGPEPLFGYLYARKIELINLNLIIAAKFQNLPTAIAKERLRKEYV